MYPELYSLLHMMVESVDNSHGGFHFRQEGEYSKKILLNVLVVESLKDA